MGKGKILEILKLKSLEGRPHRVRTWISGKGAQLDHLWISDSEEALRDGPRPWGGDTGQLVLLSPRGCNVVCPASVGKIAKWIQLLLQEGIGLATVSGNTHRNRKPRTKEEANPKCSSLLYSPALHSPSSAALWQSVTGASWQSRNVLFRVQAWAPQSRAWKVGFELYGTIPQTCLTLFPQSPHYSESTRSEAMRIKEAFVYKLLEIIIT